MTFGFCPKLSGSEMNITKETMKIKGLFAVLSAWAVVIAMFLQVVPAAAQNTPYDYVTPAMYGARGDGKRDDTDALRKALYAATSAGKVLYLPAGATYRVSGPLNYYQGKYQSYTVNILGCIPIKKGAYSETKYGGITLAKGTHLFQGATIRGSIERVSIIGTRDINTHIFSTCDCSELVVHGCNMTNIGVLFYDSPLHQVSEITQNTFLSLYYFAKNEKTSSGVMDSFISGNYINGGMELNDNVCFEWANFNGAVVTGNFIDYYRTIYQPKAVSGQSFTGPLSYANEYQVFRYLYAPGDNIQVVTFSSTADSFNWNDPETLEKLTKFKPLTYKGKDGKTYEMPPYVARCQSTWFISVQNAKVERNMRSLVFVSSSLTEYEANRFEVSFVENNPYKSGQISYRKGAEKALYNDGKYPQNELKISGIIETLDKLPSIGIGWTESVHGRTVRVGDKIYRATNQKEGGRWKASWVEVK